MADKSQAGVVKVICNDSDQSHLSQAGEGIIVAIRLRPLSCRENSSEETTGSRVWRVLKKHNSITQTTSTGQPLNDRVLNRTFFTFDKTFGENVTTSEVYDDVAKGIVDSVVNGLNGTIFAYGQTSSGKTYTIQGSGGYGGMIDTAEATDTDQTPGIIHMAARDIFKHVEKETDRVFLLKVSYVEIYNEEVRDLLVSGEREPNVLNIREDARRGVFVNANENIVTSFASVLDTLFAGDKNRSVASTLMNERSSRSHTIFRITVESRKRSIKTEADEEYNENEFDSNSVDGDDDDGSQSRGADSEDGSVLRSTLNLVDLAGSESVRHTGATGERMKEGAKINQSLLTLSRVMVGLGDPNHAHINFRDSKLTRLLQPSLSGNARMAVICCATPSHLYLEETRSTLQFASRAKLVKTNAKINEVIDERSMIKKLKRELKETKRHLNFYLSHNDEPSLLQKENTNLHREKDRIEKELELKNNQIKGVNEAYRKMLGEKVETEDELSKMRILLTNQRTTIKTLENEKKEYLDAIEALEMKISSLKDENDAVVTRNQEVTNANKDLKRRLDNFQKKSNSFHDGKNEESKIKSPYKSYGSLQANADEKVGTGEIELSASIESNTNEGPMTKRLKKLEISLVEASDNADKMRAEIAELTAANKALKSQLTSSTTKTKDIATQTEIVMYGDNLARRQYSLCTRVCLGIYYVFSSMKSRWYGTEDDNGGEFPDLQQKFI